MARGLGGGRPGAAARRPAVQSWAAWMLDAVCGADGEGPSVSAAWASTTTANARSGFVVWAAGGLEPAGWVDGNIRRSPANVGMRPFRIAIRSISSTVTRVRRPVVELRRLRRRVTRDLLRVLGRPPVRQGTR